MKKLELLDALIESLELTLAALDDNGFTVDDVAPETEPMTAIEAARVMAKFETANELAATLKTCVGKVYDWTRMSLVPNKFDAEGIELLRIEGIGRVQLTPDMNVSVKDKEKQYNWLAETGHGGIITETVNASTLKALLKRMVRDGKDVPDEIFILKPFTRASIVKS